MIVTPDQKQAAVDATKAGVAWAGAGVANAVPHDPTIMGLTLPNLAAALAAVYSALLIGEWIYKKVFRRIALRRGLIKDQRCKKD